jgi:ligand-binding sensor domain-containing protein/signal transduction histidine kinase/FixJ family two-component response regulator
MNNFWFKYTKTVLFLVVWMHFLLCKSIFALDPTKAITQYIHQFWQDELPQSTILSITQTRNGYIWFGTYKGLVRFDGVHFTVFDYSTNKNLKSNNIRALYEDKAGTLWIGTNEGLCYLKDGDFYIFTENKVLSETPIITFYQDKTETLWIGTNSGLFRLKDNNIKSYRNTEGLSSNVVTGICEDKNNVLWLGTNKGLNSLKDEKFTVYTTEQGLSNDFIRGICRDSLGNIWIATASGLTYLKDEKFTVYTTKEGLAHNLVSTVYLDKDGFLWAGTSGGISRIVNNTISNYTIEDGLSNSSIRSIYQDREGSLWVGTNSGVNRFSEAKLTTYTTKEGLALDFVRSVYEDHNGTIWIGTDGGGLNEFKNGKFKTYTMKDGLIDNSIRAISEDGQGNLWFGSVSGLSKLSNGKFTNYNKDNGLSSNYVRALYKDSQGNLWIGTEGGGVNLYKDEKFTVYSVAQGLASNNTRCISEDKNGNIWIGTYDRGLACRSKDGKFTSYTSKDGLPDDVALSFYVDKEGVLWIGTDKGLVRFKFGKFFVYTVPATPFEEVFHILEDDKNNLWVSSNEGIYQVSKLQLNNYAQGNINSISVTSYGKGDGMKSSQCNGGSQPAGTKSKDGKLWFPTAKGVVMIDPQNIVLNKVIPPVVIEKLLVDGKTVDLKNKASLSPGKEKLEFYYTTLSFVAPEKVKIRYKLEGWDRDWTESNSLRRVTYTNLPPRDYNFRVLGCNNDGVCNELGSSYSFHIETPLSQTWWAYLSYILGIAGLTYAASRYRLQTLASINKKLEAKVRSRTLELDQKNLLLGEKIDLLNDAVAKLKFSEERALESERKAIEASKYKSIFLANMSHELRTPLNIILGFAQVLARDKALNNIHRETLNTIMRSGEHLLGLINDVLSIAKIEAGKLNLHNESFDLLQLLNDIENMIRVRSQAKSLDLIFSIAPDLPQMVIGDEGKLRQVLINLLGNAIKFTKEGSVALKVSCQGDLVSFEVSDTGPGMSTEDTEKSFDAFTQAQAGKNSQEGTGLGLTISRDFVSLMGGTLDAICELGKGCIFSFTIKLPKSPENTKAETRKVIGIEALQEEVRVLVVDDVLENCKLLDMILSPLGFLVKQASNGEEAVKIWQEWHPQLIWMDIRMPVMDGYEATKQIREIEQKTNRKPTIIIAFTASVFERDKEAVLAAGCDDFVLKPVQEREVLDKLVKYLGVKLKFDTLEAEPILSKVESREEMFSPSRLSILPTELIGKLERALIVGDNKMAQQLIEQIMLCDEKLAQEMMEMVKNLQIDELLELLEGVTK